MDKSQVICSRSHNRPAPGFYPDMVWEHYPPTAPISTKTNTFWFLECVVTLTMQQECSQKYCHKCGHKGPDEDFSARYGTNGGHANWCKKCRQAYDKQYYRHRGGAEANRRWRAAHPEKNIEYCKKQYKKHGKKRLKERKKRYKEDTRYAAQLRENDRKAREKLRLEVISAYGGKCSCCGENRLPFLTLEHVNHDGKEHRERVGVRGVYVDLRKRGFPKEGFTIFCWNCQMATCNGGICPHKQII